MVAFTSFVVAQNADVSWDGTVVESTAKPASGAVVELTAGGETHRATSDESGRFAFHGLAPGSYVLSLVVHGHSIASAAPLVLSLHPASATLSLSAAGAVAVVFRTGESNREAAGKSGGEQLSSNAVSEIPLNKRDFSQLLLLAAGTATDTNGGSNYTAQFAIDGQRGAEATFAMDGADSSDPELGGATFTNFNVDAVHRDSIQFRLDACRDWTRRRWIYQRGHPVGDRGAAWVGI
jgi:hypothetical protein